MATPAEIQWSQHVLNVVADAGEPWARQAFGSEPSPLVESGQLDGRTVHVLRFYQHARGLYVDGVPGTATRERLLHDMHAMVDDVPTDAPVELQRY